MHKYRSKKVVSARQIQQDEETVVTQDGPITGVKGQWEVHDGNAVLVFDDEDFSQQYEASGSASTDSAKESPQGGKQK